MIIAIDGPAGAGKSTIAKELAKKLGFSYLDTGAMYRAVTYLALKENVDLNDEDKVVKLADTVNIEFKNEYMGIYSDIYVNNCAVTEAIRSPEVDGSVSRVSQVTGVRQAMVKRQRSMAMKNVIVEGRDIGTVVFPNADLKIFLTASEKIRAERRRGDLKAKGHGLKREEVETAMARRDSIDSTRMASPLTKARDAVLIDTSKMTIAEVVDKIISLTKNVV